MIPAAQDREQAVAEGEGEYVRAMEPGPDPFLSGDPVLSRVCREVGAIDGAYRSAHDEVRHDFDSRQGLEHADLHGAETAAAREHKRCARRLRSWCLHHLDLSIAGTRGGETSTGFGWQ